MYNIQNYIEIFFSSNVTSEIITKTYFAVKRWIEYLENEIIQVIPLSRLKIIRISLLKMSQWSSV